VQAPEHIRDYIQKRIKEIKEGAPGQLSSDGSALCVHGSLGYDCYITPECEAFTEEYELGDDSLPVRNHSRRGQILALVLSANFGNALFAELIPHRTVDASTCGPRAGEGSIKIGRRGRLICEECCGLGWLSIGL